jgi:flagellar protein FliL
MTDIDQAAALALREPRGSSSVMKWAIIGAVLLLLVGGGGAGWYFMFGGHPGHPQKEVEAPLPYFLELKPFVVTMPGNNGSSHFVQLGASLQMPRAAAGEMATALLPEVQDTMRQTLLTFKSEDLQNPDGVNKVRKTMTKQLNELMASVLGKDRLSRITDGSPDGAVVQNILFPTLIVE